MIQLKWETSLVKCLVFVVQVDALRVFGERLGKERHFDAPNIDTTLKAVVKRSDLFPFCDSTYLVLTYCLLYLVYEH